MSSKVKYCKYLEKTVKLMSPGEELAQQLQISFRYLESNQRIKKEGYQIISVTNKGYCLSDETDVISAEGIGPHLTYGSQDMICYVFKTVDSHPILLLKNGFREGTSLYCSSVRKNKPQDAEEWDVLFTPRR